MSTRSTRARRPKRPTYPTSPTYPLNSSCRRTRSPRTPGSHTPMHPAEDNQHLAEESGRLVVRLAREFARVDQMIARAERSPGSAATGWALAALYRRFRCAQLRRRLAALPHDERAWIVRPLMEEPSPTARQVVRPLLRQMGIPLQ